MDGLDEERKIIKPFRVKKPVIWQTPNFVKDFYSFIIGQPPIESPKPRKINLLK